MNEELERFGWDGAWEAEFVRAAPPSHFAGRAVEEQKEHYRIATAQGEMWAEISGKLRYLAGSRADFPAVGDWVVAERDSGRESATIHAVLPRRNRLSRKEPGTEAGEQILAANVDAAFLVTSFSAEFNIRRMERYQASLAASGIRCAIVVNKSDTCADKAGFLEKVSASQGEVLAVSALTGEGMEALDPYLVQSRTIVVLGSSGVGKSTLINRLMGREAQRTGDVSNDRHGRHTTTFRRLLALPNGALLVDTPGLREFQPWADEEAVDDVFPEITALAEGCRYRDCGHEAEPGCEVRAALEEGALAADRYAGFLKLKREALFLKRKMDKAAELAYKNSAKKLSRMVRQAGARKRRD